MPTPAQIEASRISAVRHGLLAQSVLIGGEDPALFRASVDDLVRRYCPADNVELAYVEQIAASAWRLRRAERIEAAVLNRQLGIPVDDPILDRLASATPDLETHRRHQERLARAQQRAVNALFKLRKQCPFTEPAPLPALPAPAPPKQTNEPKPKPIPSPTYSPYPANYFRPIDDLLGRTG